MAFEPQPPDSLGPIVYASASGSNVLDVDGNRYVDLCAGFGAILLGHGAPQPAHSLLSQAQRLWTALGDVYASDVKIEMLERVTGLYPTAGAQALLCQSGSDCITAAVKTAHLHTGRPGIVAFEGAYHGLGYGALAACGYRPSFRTPFSDQLNPHVRFAPYPHSDADLDSALLEVEHLLEGNQVGAVIVEPILGRGGCVLPPADFLPRLATLARRAGALLIADEIWTGLGRSGWMLACSAVGVIPDVVCFGKGLGGGLPISACIAPQAVMQAWKHTPGVVHTSTFQGNALACATAVATIDAVQSLKLAERARELGGRLLHRLRSCLADSPLVRKVTGAGLMVGIQLGSGPLASQLCSDLLAKGYIALTGGVDGSVLTITPPLSIDEALLDGFVGTLVQLLQERGRA